MKLFTKSYLAFFVMMLMSASLFLTTSCDKDDDKDEIIGTWEFEKSVVTVGEQTLEYTAAQMELEITVVVKDDGNYTATSVDTDGTDTSSGTWKRVDANLVQFTEDGDTMDFKKDGSKYYIEEYDAEYEMTMKMYFIKG